MENFLLSAERLLEQFNSIQCIRHIGVSVFVSVETSVRSPGKLFVFNIHENAYRTVRTSMVENGKPGILLKIVWFMR